MAPAGRTWWHVGTCCCPPATGPFGMQVERDLTKGTGDGTPLAVITGTPDSPAFPQAKFRASAGWGGGPWCPQSISTLAIGWALGCVGPGPPTDGAFHPGLSSKNKNCAECLIPFATLHPTFPLSPNPHPTPVLTLATSPRASKRQVRSSLYSWGQTSMCVFLETMTTILGVYVPKLCTHTWELSSTCPQETGWEPWMS